MAYDGNGNFIRLHNWTQDAANGLDINATEVDGEDNGFAAGLSLAVTRDGQGKMTTDFLPNSDNTLNLGTTIRRWATLNGIPVANLPITQANVGALLYPQSAAETTAPVNLWYPYGHIFRYGVTANGATDDTAAMNLAIAACNAGGYRLSREGVTGTILISSALTTFSSQGGIDLASTNSGSQGVTILASGTSGYTALTVINAPQMIHVYVQGSGNTVNGIYLNQILLCNDIDIRAYNFAGSGVRIDECSDCFFKNVSVQGCGTSTVYAFSMNLVGGNACEESVFAHLQVENCGARAMYIDPQTFCCTFEHIHSEQSVGDGTNPTHILGGQYCNYISTRIESNSNVLAYLECAGSNFGPFKAVGTNVVLQGGGNYAYSFNEIHDMVCANLTWSATNTGAWRVFDSGITGTVSILGGLNGQALLDGTSMVNLSVSGSNNVAQLDDCVVSGTLTSVSGVTGLVARKTAFTATGSIPFIANTLRECTFSTGVSMGGNVDATQCTFSGSVTITGSGFLWNSDACNYAGGLVLGGGTPGWRFGPRDRVSGGGGVPAAFQAAPTSSSVAFVQGDKTWNMAPNATGSVAYVCTTAGTPGTWTGITIP